MTNTLAQEPTQDPYALEGRLVELPAEERAAALRDTLQRWGKPAHFTLADLKEEHAFGVLLGRPLHQFPPGRFEMYGYNGEPDDDTALVFRFDEEDRIIPCEPHSPATRDLEMGGGFDVIPTDGTLFGAMRQILDWVRGEMSAHKGPPQSTANDGPLAQIRDPGLRAAMRWMRDGNPRLERALADCSYVPPLFALRPGLEFVVAWESIAPLSDVAQVIVRVPSEI